MGIGGGVDIINGGVRVTGKWDGNVIVVTSVSSTDGDDTATDGAERSTGSAV